MDWRKVKKRSNRRGLPVSHRGDETEDRLIRLHPEPVLKSITLDVAEEGLRFLEIDIDAFVSARGEARPVPKPVAPSRAKEFLEAVLENSKAFNIDAMPADRALVVLETVAAAFFFECLSTFSGRTNPGGR